MKKKEGAQVNNIMEEGELHCILNIEKYADYVRKSAALSFAEEDALDESEDLENYITINQACQMIKENSIGQDEEGKYLITEEASRLLFEQIRTRIYNSGLSKLAAKDLVECSWDEKKNTMVFWSRKA
jgi:hypothetical protein